MEFAVYTKALRGWRNVVVNWAHREIQSTMLWIPSPKLLTAKLLEYCFPPNPSWNQCGGHHLSSSSRNHCGRTFGVVVDIQLNHVEYSEFEWVQREINIIPPIGVKCSNQFAPRILWPYTNNEGLRMPDYTNAFEWSPNRMMRLITIIARTNNQHNSTYPSSAHRNKEPICWITIQ